MLKELMHTHKTCLHNAAVCELELVSILASRTNDRENRRRLCRSMMILETVIAKLRTEIGMANDPI